LFPRPYLPAGFTSPQEIVSQLYIHSILGLSFSRGYFFQLNKTDFYSNIFNMETFGEKILVVDDNIELIDIIRKFLRTQNFEVLTALDGKTAIEKTLSDAPELVILD
jgi:hypothetical protein